MSESFDPVSRYVVYHQSGSRFNESNVSKYWLWVKNAPEGTCIVSGGILSSQLLDMWILL